jgi:DNA modification methylase
MAVIDQHITDRYALYHSDCMEVLPSLKSNSVGFSVYSPPFPELYAYSNDPRDMSNCVNYDEGMAQYRYVVEQLHRATMPGRLTAVHCMDLKKGSYYQRDFPGDIRRMHEDLGWNLWCKITIWKDPWLIARRTRMKSLQHKMIVNDSSKCRTAGPDYLYVFKKGGDNPEPIIHPSGLKRYAGETPMPADLVARFAGFDGDQRKNLLSHWIWRRYASPVWMDIRSGNLLPYQGAKENEEEKHVCPLQLDVIERALTLWSNPGDVVVTPYLGVGSEAYQAVKMGRKAIGSELKATYFRQAVKNLQLADVSDADDQFLLALNGGMNVDDGTMDEEEGEEE